MLGFYAWKAENHEILKLQQQTRERENKFIIFTDFTMINNTVVTIWDVTDLLSLTNIFKLSKPSWKCSTSSAVKGMCFGEVNAFQCTSFHVLSLSFTSMIYFPTKADKPGMICHPFHADSIFCRWSIHRYRWVFVTCRDTHCWSKYCHRFNQ